MKDYKQIYFYGNLFPIFNKVDQWHVNLQVMRLSITWVNNQAL